MQDNHPISRFALTPANPLFPRKATFTGFLARVWGPYCEWTGNLEDCRPSALLWLPVGRVDADSGSGLRYFWLPAPTPVTHPAV